MLFDVLNDELCMAGHTGLPVHQSRSHFLQRVDAWSWCYAVTHNPKRFCVRMDELLTDADDLSCNSGHMSMYDLTLDRRIGYNSACIWKISPELLYQTGGLGSANLIMSFKLAPKRTLLPW